jgi:predicted nucleic acid-binding protein
VSEPFIDSNIVFYLLSGDAAKADRAEVQNNKSKQHDAID